LREHRHELFDERFQAELGAAYPEGTIGQPPVPPALLALATILQAYTGSSDDEAVECTLMDRRWQLVLDCLDVRYPPFSKGTLVSFRRRLIEHYLDRRLVGAHGTDQGVRPAPAAGGAELRPVPSGNTRSSGLDGHVRSCYEVVGVGR
jgi:hypothetical protein